MTSRHSTSRFSRRTFCLSLTTPLFGNDKRQRYLVTFAKSDQQTLARQQQSVREEVEKAGGKVVAVLNIVSSLAVEVDAKTAEKLKGMPGVVRVVVDTPVRARPAK